MIRDKVVEEIDNGKTPLDIAKKFSLSLDFIFLVIDQHNRISTNKIKSFSCSNKKDCSKLPCARNCPFTQVSRSNDKYSFRF
jgi:hypothetical protein